MAPEKWLNYQIEERCQMKKKNESKRKEIKSSEGEFLYELRNSYELSPKLSEQILVSAKEHLLRDHQLREGQHEVTVVAIEEKNGKMVEHMEKKRVRLTFDNGIEDQESLAEVGYHGLRQIRIQRMTEEAVEQGGVLSQEDLSKYLLTSVRTIKRDIQEIRDRGIEVITRGVLHNIGRGQTHKARIIGLFLEGLTYSEVKLKMRHSVGAIKRYLEGFTKVVMSEHRGITKAKEISMVTGLSEHLVGQYQELIRVSKMDSLKAGNLQELIERSEYREGVKKRLKTSGNEVVRMIGGRR